MGQIAERFAALKLAPRQAEIPVPALATLLNEEEPVWVVRGLTAAELHRALEAGKRQGSIEQIVRAIAGSGDQAEAVRSALGLSKDTPGEIAKRLEMLVVGTVGREVDLADAVRIGEGFPIEFLSLTNRITELTGQGFDMVKPEAASQPIPA